MTDYAKHIETFLYMSEDDLQTRAVPTWAERTEAVRAAIELMRAADAPEDQSTSVRALWCPWCGKPHVDEGEWATRKHHKHLCVSDAHGTGCGKLFRIETFVFGAPQQRAATPKNEAEEREYCVRRSREILMRDEVGRTAGLARERAAARAEGYEAGKHSADEGLQADANTVLELAAARAEIAEHERAHDERAQHIVTLQAEIARLQDAWAADADRMLQGRVEIERLRRESRQNFAACQDANADVFALETKLVILRAAAEFARGELRHAEGDRVECACEVLDSALRGALMRRGKR